MFKKINLINYFAGTKSTQLLIDDPLCLLNVPREAINTHIKAERCGVVGDIMDILGVVGDTMDVLKESRCIQVDYCIDLERGFVITTLSQVPVGKRKYRNKLAMYYITKKGNVACVLEQVGPVHTGTRCHCGRYRRFTLKGEHNDYIWFYKLRRRVQEVPNTQRQSPRYL